MDDNAIMLGMNCKENARNVGSHKSLFQSTQAYRWLRPSYWLYELFYLFTWCLSRLDQRVLFALGRGLGRLAYCVATKPRVIASRNLQLCFPERSLAWVQKTTKCYFQNLGIGVMEFVMALWWSDDDCRHLIHVEGLAILEQANQSKRGVILLTGHFTCLEMLIRIAGLSGYALQGVYRDLKKPWLNQIVYQHRHRSVTQMIERSQTRQIVRGLKQGAMMLYLPDMDMGKRFDSVFAPFFGIPAATITATSRLAKHANAIVLPISYYRLPGSQGYQIIIHEALSDFPTDNTEGDAARINATLEQAIRYQPDQYFWHQKRFRRRPPGSPSLYS